MPTSFSTKRLTAIVALSCISIPSSFAEAPLNYFEVGFGATNLGLMEKVNTSAEVSPAASARVLIGGKLTSKNLWFETMYQYNGQFEDSRTDVQGTITEKDVTTYSNHSVSFGLKATTNPYNPLSVFLKGGVGFNRYSKELSSTSSDSSNNSVSSTRESFTKTSNLFYAGAGLSLKLTHKTKINFDVTSTQYSIFDTEVNDIAAFVSYNKFL